MVTRCDYLYRMTSRTVEIHGFALREIREDRGRKVSEFAASLGVDRSYITHLENGTKYRVSPELYAAICKQLAVRDRRSLLAHAPHVDAAEKVPA